MEFEDDRPSAPMNQEAAAALEKNLQRYWRESAYVTDDEAATRLRRHLRESRAAAERGDEESAATDGAGERAEGQRVLLRALGAAVVIGLLLMTLRGPAAAAGFAILQGAPEVEAAGSAYFHIRAWGAVGAFASFALTGWLIGLGRTRSVLAVNVVFCLTNLVLDFWFVLGLGWGVAGVAAATAIAEVVNALTAGALVLFAVTQRGGWLEGVVTRAALLDPAAARRLFAVNIDLMLRTWALVLGFSWFANVGATLGTAVLAGNHVLLQIVSVWAFVLDAYAFVAETEVGHAVGARSIAHAAGLIEHEEAFLGGLFADLGVMAMVQTVADEDQVSERFFAALRGVAVAVMPMQELLEQVEGCEPCQYPKERC